MANIAKLRKTLGRIDGLRTASVGELIKLEMLQVLEEDVWDQGRWITPAKGSGGELCIITERGVMHNGQSCHTAACLAGWTLIDFAPAGTTLEGRTATLPGGEVISVHEFARREHELTHLQAAALFSGANSLNDLHNIVDRIEKEEENG
jgi:hypothetical protein